MTSHGSYRGLFIAVALFIMLPLAFVKYVPMVDFAGHLGRIHILRYYHQFPQFQSTYELSPNIVPNMALDAIILPLSYVISLLAAARVFVALTHVIFALGCWTLSNSVYGRITPLAVLALFAQYNSVFLYGFVAFQLSVGLTLIAIGLWYRWRAHWSALRIGALSIFVVLIYFCHLGGYLYLGMAIGWLTLLGWRREKTVSLASVTGLLPLIPPLLIHLSLRVNPVQSTAIEFSSLSLKLRHAGMLLTGYDLYVDAAVAILLAVSLAAAFLYGKCRFQPDLGSTGLVFAIAFAVLPGLLMTGSDADTRMLVGAGVFLAMAFSCEISPVRGRLIYSIALLALMIRVGYCGVVWKRQSDYMAGLVTLIDQVPAGSRVFPLTDLPTDLKSNKFERVVLHLPDFATVDREAIVPTVFAVPGQHLVVERTPLWYPNDIDWLHPEKFDWDRVAREYDTIWQYGKDPVLKAFLDRRFHLAGRHGDASLYRIR